MTYYVAGKLRIGDEISKKIYEVATALEKKHNIEIEGYAELFCGMLGVYKHIPELFKDYDLDYIASDKNPYIIKLWNGVKKGFKPPTKCSSKEYYEYKDKDSKSLKAIFLGYAHAIRGTFRSTYVKGRNIQKQAENVVEIGKKLKDVEFYSGDYSDYSDLKNFILYLDPPYRGTTAPYSNGNKYETKFDYDRFLKWCAKMNKDNIIFISEYTKPNNNSILLWQKGKEQLYLFIE